ncbi:MAG: tetratricopeptide repeat protein [Polyangiaceae bacterium]|nr:tetratricopeptide repeat protein [Polyangiaceae bacterium]
MSKRLEMLQRLVASGSTDPFARYGLAMEQRSLGDREAARATFGELRAQAPGYVPQYLMAAQLEVELGDHAAARVIGEAGLVAARDKGDSHALHELETLLAGLG